MKKAKQLPADQQAALLATLKTRFEKHPHRHKSLEWSKVEKKLTASPDKLYILNEMEITGGEPDVVGYDKTTDEFIFYDCSAESPKERRSLCYDREALDSRKDAPPVDSALDMAAAIGITILTEDEYRSLQQLGKFDMKTSSWIKTPDSIRALGGAIFCDRRYDHVFTYHNGASSYYAARGFRGSIRV
jgi:hypothetical protein